MADESDHEQESEPEQVCKKHGDRLDQYCIKCNELLCSECIHDPKHKEHLQKGEVLLARKILQEQLDTLSEKQEPASSLVTRAGEMKQQVEMKKESVASNCEETKAEIEVFFEAVKKRLEDRERSLIAAIEENANMKLAVLEEHSQTLEKSQMSAVKATEAISRLCQTRDIHCLTEDQRISEDIRQCQQSLEKLEAELDNPDLNLILKFKEDTSLEGQLNTLGTLTECECGTSKVKYELTVGKDGKLFKDSPAPATVQTQYIVIAETNGKYTRSASFPCLDQSTISSPSYSPTKAPVVPPRPSSQLSGVSHKRNTESLIPPRSQSGMKNGPVYIRPHSYEVLYDTPDTPGVDSSPNSREVSHSGANSECKHKVVPEWEPPLPYDTTRNLIRQQGKKNRAQTIEIDNTNQSKPHVYETLSLPDPQPRAQTRHEPIIIEPVQVISTKQLCHTSDNVLPFGIHCASGSDNIMITDVQNDCLRQLDKDGSFLEKIGSAGKDDGQFEGPTALAVGAGYMYVTDLATNGRLQKFSRYGLFVSKCGKRHLRKPYGVAISQKDQSVYISDCQKQQVCIYDHNCRFVGSIGKSQGVKLEYPVGIAFDTAGNLLVVDRGQQCGCVWQIDISKPKAKVVAKIGEGHLHYPFGITVTQDGSIVVTEQENLNCVFVFSSRGNLIQCFGKTGSKPGMFNSPSGVTVNSKGQIIVADTYNQRLQVFSLPK